MKTIDWGGAWKKGLLEGLIVYPVAALVDVLSFQFDPALTGWGQIWALVITTLVVRLVVMALTFKGTLDQQKMQAMQPELAKLQAKYPNSKDNKAQAARLSQETMALYKRNKVSMFSPFLMMLIQFPVFMAIWTALSGNAALSSGEVLNLRLSDSLSSVLMNFSGTWYLNTTGWWTALVLFILMGGFQFCAMKLPQWITKAQTRKQVKLTANPTADDNANRMKIVSIVMFVFTLIMGFALPAAMGIYWAIGAIVSMLQTLITQLVIAKRVKKKRERRR
jgi:YidC/Oxa1 family membrane protein insertase